MKSKRGILLLNLGGPWNLSEVRGFLYRLFSDREILVGVPTPFRQMAAALIALVKGPSSRRMYRQIGGGSPQLHWTQMQAAFLEQGLTDSKVEIGMRAASPSIADALKRLQTWGATELVLLPLFPHYSRTTTGSCFQETQRQLNRLGWRPAVSLVRSWADHDDFISLIQQAVEEKLDAMLKAGIDRGDIHILLSAHSLPMKIIERGDPYESEVQRTVRALHPEKWGVGWSLAYQSRNGKMPWLAPYVEEQIMQLSKTGVRHLLLVPISFVSDHIETLYELDLLYANQARTLGIETVARTPSFNGNPAFGTCLVRVLSERSETVVDNGTMQ